MLYDPDWNPSTDMQARERAWRIGQVNRVVHNPCMNTAPSCGRSPGSRPILQLLGAGCSMRQPAVS